jgi:outer membrane cobalamin receptor
MRYIATIALLVFASPAFVMAQSPPGQGEPGGPPRFDTEVVVTPERAETARGLVPVATAVLDAEQLQTLPAAHPAELLSFLPGFAVARGEFLVGRPAVHARGFFGGGEAEYVLMLVDGVPISDVESGLINYSLIPVAAVQRIEAARGPGAALYGDSAVGGVIQVLTDRRSGGGLFTATGGSFATLTADGMFRRQVEGIGFSVSGAARRTDGGLDHAHGREIVGTGTVDGRTGRFSWRGTTTGDGRDRDDPGALSRTQLSLDPYASDPLYRFDAVSRGSLLASFSVRHDSAWRPQARLYAGARDEDLVRTILLVPGFGDRRARQLSSANVGVSLEGERGFGARAPLVRFGIDLARERLDTSYREVDEDGQIGALDSQASGRRLRSGMYVSAAWTPIARARISGAIRWDGVDDDGFDRSASDVQRAWSPRAGITVQLTERGTMSLFGQVSRAFKVPTLDQLFDPRPYPDFQGGTLTISNPDLVPQRATNVEAGITAGGRLRWSALAYHMTVDDEIDFDARTFSYANIGRSRHDGIELEAEARWWRRVRPSASYSLARVVDADSGRQLKNVPRHFFTASAHLEAPGSVGAVIRYRRATGAFLDDEGVFAVDGQSTLDIRMRRPLGRQAVFVDLLNVTGNRYEEFGFTLADFDGSVAPYAYSGPPRAVRAGLTLSF